MPPRALPLTLLAMAAFAANSLLCRAALTHTATDPATFTALRLLSGAAATWAIARRGKGKGGSWPSAIALFVYAAGFSFAYVALQAGLGAFLLFTAVQATMVLAGLLRGERLGPPQWAGLALALGGLFGLLAPGRTAPPLPAALLMLAAGVAWGVYSLRGREAGDPGRATAGNFLRAVPLALALSLILLPWSRVDAAGAGYAVASGALGSGLGYAVWYAAMRGLRTTTASAVQLSVPVLAALAGVAILGEPVTARLLGGSAAILGGLALILLKAGNRRR
ncbi:DMT family transporter [Geothrix sp. 21YS21S-2]|uniref:DMT family transporter n=1 Tax=Geothrix sp. 21YS21S-2 TaxID=3068893 RepID=UPI0027B987A8|nr:DMT family transporter [Geothrix sp. 21YS21S-2]